MDDLVKITIGLLVYLCTMVFVTLGMTIALSLSWNNVMPYLFHLPTIDWGQAFALSWVASALFKPYVNIPEIHK